MGSPTIYYATSKSITLSQRPQRQQFLDPDQVVVSNTAISGIEERLNVRLDLPVSFSFRYFVTPTEATLKRNLQQWLALAKEGGEWFFALDSAEKVLTTLSDSSLAGDSSVEVTSATGIVIGNQYLIRSSTRGELVKVAGVSGTTITLTETLNNDWFTGDRFRSEQYWPGRLVKPRNVLVEREPLWFDLNLEFIEDASDL